MRRMGLYFVMLLLGWPIPIRAQQPPSGIPGRLSVTNTQIPEPSPKEFQVPRPAHAQSPYREISPSFKVESSREGSNPRAPQEWGTADFLLPELETKESITPESANLNLPIDTPLVSTDTGEKILLPAGTYRQIMKFPINSPLMQEDTRSRELKSPVITTDKPKSRYATPPKDPVWVRYEGLEKIKIGEVERRGGLDIPSHGPKSLGPRVWYAKSETADLASSAFYFVFGGLGYGIANLAGWSAGNTREVPGDFEYRLIRR